MSHMFGLTSTVSRLTQCTYSTETKAPLSFWISPSFSCVLCVKCIKWTHNREDAYVHLHISSQKLTHFDETCYWGGSLKSLDEFNFNRHRLNINSTSDGAQIKIIIFPKTAHRNKKLEHDSKYRSLRYETFIRNIVWCVVCLTKYATLQICICNK